MKLGHKYLFAAVIMLFIFTGMMLAQSNPTIKDIKVEAFDGYIRVSWEVYSEAGVDHYEVRRSSGTSVPLYIGRTECGVKYYDDKNIGFYKTEDQYFSYQVRVIGTNQSLQSNSEIKGIRYSSPSNTYKSTWGSIKAMFR